MDGISASHLGTEAAPDGVPADFVTGRRCPPRQVVGMGKSASLTRAGWLYRRSWGLIMRESRILLSRFRLYCYLLVLLTDSALVFPPIPKMPCTIFPCFVLVAVLTQCTAAIAFPQGADEAAQQLKSSEMPVAPWRSLPVGLDATHVIDLALEHGWQTRSIVSTSEIDDPAFARRLFLDLVGRVPRPKELQDFLAQTNSNKRAVLIDKLLASNEHAEHLAEVLTQS